MVMKGGVCESVGMNVNKKMLSCKLKIIHCLTDRQ